ncbi:hypothetical protein [Rhizosaccharibacter radicis]|uniref:Uncharacterized protein n=1 Tax=Rhizosaccharibacter radicis TaxID=2782605 RepID=A0ABT1VZA4_9PROT|nr:hypothetical protein [Acetobacteraceae bacterium KSS12]
MLVAMLDVAASLARTGVGVSLEGLEDRVGMLCAQTLDLGPDAAASVRPILLRLRNRLDGVTALLKPPDPGTPPLTA